jgi:regulator of protease activity HflC (stomatin/prohibitin superfamily)
MRRRFKALQSFINDKGGDPVKHGMSLVAEVERQVRARKAEEHSFAPRKPKPAKTATPVTFNENQGERIMFYNKFIVRKHERALLFRDGDFVKFLEPGVYRFGTLLHAYTVERFDISTPLFGHRLQDFLIEKYPRQVERYFDVVKTDENEIAVVYHNDNITLIMASATRHLFTKGVHKIRVERFEFVENLDVEKRLAKRLLAGNDAMLKSIADKAIYSRVVPDGHIGLLYVDGELTRSLASGFHAFFAVERGVTVELFDTRVQTLEVSGQEILTKDKVSLRINLTATYQLTDIEKAVRAAKDPLDHLYKEVQFGLRGAVGTRTLDALLEDKEVIDTSVADHLKKRFKAIGITVKSVGVKDIILPGDMKDLLGKVVEAEKSAQANVIRRREETNATRSLVNTAKVMETNAVALRLKELETLEKITEKIGNISVYGGLDSLLNDLVRMKQ